MVRVDLVRGRLEERPVSIHDAMDDRERRIDEACKRCKGHGVTSVMGGWPVRCADCLPPLESPGETLERELRRMER
jgi:hypothetical protein